MTEETPAEFGPLNAPGPAVPIDRSGFASPATHRAAESPAGGTFGCLAPSGDDAVLTLGSGAGMALALKHELSQSLTVIANHVHIARARLSGTDGDRDATLRSLDVAGVMTQRAIDTIRSLGALAEGHAAVRKAEYLAEIIAEIMPILLICAHEHDAELVLDVDPTDQRACDRTQIQQLILNLAGNAMEAPGNGLRRRVRIAGWPDGPNGYRMKVEDNGPGITPAVRQQLFEPLVSTKRDSMGLGLPICRMIVEAHGGRIDTGISTLGGAAFIFSLNDTVRALDE